MHSRRVWKWMIAIPAFILSVVVAHAAQWHVVQSSGEVWLGSAAAQQVALKRAAVVPDSGIIVTGKTGRVALARGADTMVVGPNSVIVVPADRHGQTTILQRVGEVAFTVERRSVPHFTVETPFLAAVVKGTRFTVQVSSTGADVILDRGLVGVSALAAGETVDIAPGQYVIVRGADHLSVGGIGTLNKIEKGKPRAPVLDPLSLSQLWDIAAGRLGGLALGLVAESNNANGVGLAIGQGGGNAGGNGKAKAGGNAGGNGKSNAGGNGNSNAGGNGNSNAGGNGKGNAFGHNK
jgi:hypothetical protein